MPLPDLLALLRNEGDLTDVKFFINPTDRTPVEQLSRELNELLASIENVEPVRRFEDAK
jgi:hypothetical protein